MQALRLIALKLTVFFETGGCLLVWVLSVWQHFCLPPKRNSSLLLPLAAGHNPLHLLVSSVVIPLLSLLAAGDLWHYGHSDEGTPDRRGGYWSGPAAPALQREGSGTSEYRCLAPS